MKARKPVQADNLAKDAIATALGAFEQIDAEATRKKLAHRGVLEQAKAKALERIEELQQQVGQLDEALAAVDSIKQPPLKSAPPKPTQPKSSLPKSASSPSAPAEPARRKPRRNLGKIRKRIVRFLTENKGKKFSAPELLKEFPALKGVQISAFLKPLREAGTIKDDVSEGIIKTKYFIAKT